jgi:hypothetical protein
MAALVSDHVPDLVGDRCVAENLLSTIEVTQIY